MVGFRDLVGTDFAPVSNKTAVNATFSKSQKSYYGRTQCISLDDSVIKGWSKPNIYITLWFGTQIKPNSMTETFSFSKTDFVGVAEAKHWPPIWCEDVFKQCPESRIIFLRM